MVNTGAETLALVTVTPSFIILPDSPYMEGPEQASKPGGGGWGGGGAQDAVMALGGVKVGGDQKVNCVG